MPDSLWVLLYLGIAFEATGSVLKAIHITYEECECEKQRKLELLYEFHLFEERGYPTSKRFSMASDLSEMKCEYYHLRRKENKDKLKLEQERIIKFWEISFTPHKTFSLEII